jgi:hypothetical protein
VIRTLLEVARGELRVLIRSPAAWATAAVFFAAHAALFVQLLALEEAMQAAAWAGSESQRSFAGLLGAHGTNVGLLLVLFVPLVTQGLLPGGPAQWVVLATPASSGGVVAGKWIATTVYIGGLVFVAQLPVLLSPTLTSGQGVRGSVLLASLLLLTAAATAVGTLASAWAAHRTGATVLAWALLLALWALGRDEVQGLGARFTSLCSGLVELADIGWIVGLTWGSLAVATWALEARRWS